MKLEASLSPSKVLTQVAGALPADVRSNVIIIGSLAAGYHFFAGDGARAIRTKDVDCLFSPHSKAIAVATEVTDQLIKADWELREDPDWGEPGNEGDSEDKLPMVRLRPPGGTTSPWFLELLSAPPAFEPGAPSKKLRRVETSIGHFAICSFDFLALAEWQPLETVHGVRIARPEMMALANLLHHPEIADTLIAGTDYKRSNKDLGRVLALAYLAVQRDRRGDTEEFDAWAGRMWSALKDKFDDQAPRLGARAGAGLRELLESPTKKPYTP
ncbi:MAG: hypothetical protein JSR59_19495, partial [Proteobacteria bacterium]|nr:hypothetical protein [Pseudomonadota bacterium]